MKILLTAFAFEPCETSEPGAAWRFANIAARQHHVTVLTGGFPGPVERTRAYLENHPELRIRAVPFWPLGFPKLFGWKLINLHYWLWQRQLLTPALKLHREIRFDLIHHVTLSRYWVGSSISRLGPPLIWGPVGSGGNTPLSFAGDLPIRAKCANQARELSAHLCRLDPLLNRTLRKASICFAMNRDTALKLRGHGVQKVEELPQICFSSNRLGELGKTPPPPMPPPIRMLSIGRLVYWKGFQYGIQACAELKRRGVSFEYRIVGWGPFENNLLALIRKLNLSSCVLLAGRMTNEEVLDKEMARAHLLLHPALHESFGNVCLEALACGRPVVCLNVGGPASQVTPACGYAVSVESPQRAVIEIADAVEGLFSSPDKWQQMSAAARARANHYFSLERLESRIQKAYADLEPRNS